MTETPSTNPDAGLADEPEESIQEQIDRLLLKIEAQDPGVVPREPQAADTAQDETAEAMAQFEQAIEPANPPQQAPEPIPAPAPAPSSIDEPVDAEEGEMLASINSAMEDAESTQAELDTPVEPQALDHRSENSTDTQLQDEIAALLNADPQQQDNELEPATPAESVQEKIAEDIEDLLKAEPQQQNIESTPTASIESVEDLIADEIEGLLAAEEQASAAASSTPGDPSIDQLDQMLAEEIDADDELAGDFQSVQDVTAGIETDDAAQLETEDAHAASARDVAAELDSQPEDLPPTKPQPGEMGDDPLAAIAAIAEVAQTNEIAYQEQVTGNIPGWRGRLIRGRNRLYRFCFALNWPARELLSTENRANLGYVALMVLVSAVALWAYVILL